MGHKFISKKKKTQNLNSSDNQQRKSISKFDTQSDNLENYQDMADSSLKVSQLHKIQDKANGNTIQLNPLENVSDPDDDTRFENLSEEEKNIISDGALGYVTTKEGATEAVRRGQTGKLPHPKVIVGKDAYEAHKKKFKVNEGGAARFETPDIDDGSIHQKDWGYGQDFKFVTTKKEADELENDTKNADVDADGGPGIWHMEKRLGAEPGRWIDKSLGGEKDNPNHEMVRYDFPDPEKYDLDMAKGDEIDAFQDQWKAGGQTLGGMNEAVIKSMNKMKFLAEIAMGNIIRKEKEFPKTKKKNIPKTKKKK